MNYDDVLNAKKSGSPLNMGGMSDKVVPPMPAELEEMGQVVQDTEDAAYSEAAPTGDFHVKALNNVVQALNSLLPMFRVDAYPVFAEDTTVFPADFLKLVMMVVQAASDSGSQEIDLSSIKTDRDLVMLAGALAALAKDRDFKEFLAKPAVSKPKAPVAEKEKSEPAPSDESMDNLFASRS